MLDKFDEIVKGYFSIYELNDYDDPYVSELFGKASCLLARLCGNIKCLILALSVLNSFEKICNQKNYMHI